MKKVVITLEVTSHLNVRLDIKRNLQQVRFLQLQRLNSSEESILF